jgi:hypothetical protein
MAVEIAEPILNYWYRALHSPRGIELICSDVESIRAKLYMARKDAKDDDLKKVAVCLSPFDPMKLWLVKKEPSDAQA